MKIPKLLKYLVFTIILAALGWLLPQSVGLAAGGFDSAFVLQQFSFYLAGFIFLIIVLGVALVELFINKKDNQYGDSIAYINQGESPSLGFFKKFSTFQLFILFSIIFSILGLIAVYKSQTAFTGFKVLEQQFTPAGELLYSAFLIPIAENAGAMAIIALSFFGLRHLARKYNWNKGTFIGLCYLIIPLFTGIYGYLNHLLRYGSSEISKTVVFFFWYLGGLITVLTGNAVPFLVMHQDNNLFFDLRRLYSNDIWIIVCIGIIVLVSVFYMWFYVIRKRKVEGDNIQNI